MDPIRALELDSEFMMELVQAIPVLQAREKLDSFATADYPYMKPAKRSKMVAALKREANPSILEEQAEEFEPAQLIAMLNQ